jgi:hypothetical protein
MSEEIKTLQGFFVKISDCIYSGPFASLNEARADARARGPNLSIYHGILKYLSDSLIDDKDLFLVPKYKKE